MLVDSVSQSYHFSSENISLSARSLSNNLEMLFGVEQDYVYLLDMTARDSLLGEKHSKTVRACQAVARYYEAVSLYKAYLAVGDLTAAGTQIERMEQYAVQTEEFGEYVEKKINQLFELDEAVDRAE